MTCNNRLIAIFGVWGLWIRCLPRAEVSLTMRTRIIVAVLSGTKSVCELFGAKEQTVTENYMGLRPNFTTSNLHLTGLLSRLLKEGMSLEGDVACM